MYNLLEGRAGGCRHCLWFGFAAARNTLNETPGKWTIPERKEKNKPRTVTTPQEYFVWVSYDYDNLQNQMLGGTLLSSEYTIYLHQMHTFLKACWKFSQGACRVGRSFFLMPENCEIHKAIQRLSIYQHYMANPLNKYCGKEPLVKG